MLANNSTIQVAAAMCACFYCSFMWISSAWVAKKIDGGRETVGLILKMKMIGKKRVFFLPFGAAMLHLFLGL